MEPLITYRDVEHYQFDERECEFILESAQSIMPYSKAHNRPPARTEEQLLRTNVVGQIGEATLYKWYGRGAIGFYDYYERRLLLNHSTQGDGKCDLLINSRRIDVKATLANWRPRSLPDRKLRMYENDLFSQWCPSYFVYVVVERPLCIDHLAKVTSHIIGYIAATYARAYSHAIDDERYKGEAREVELGWLHPIEELRPHDQFSSL